MLFLPNKNILIIILALLLSSCNPFISKELRHKKKCNRKLERVLKRCPELLKTDTIIVRFDTTIVTNEVRVDTVISMQFDTFELIKDKFHLKLIRTRDTLIIDGGCDADTIYIETFIPVPYQKIETIQLTIWDQVMLALGKFWWWLVIAAILFVAYRLLLKR